MNGRQPSFHHHENGRHKKKDIQNSRDDFHSVVKCVCLGVHYSTNAVYFITGCKKYQGEKQSDSTGG
jgi:hypothetical protein